MRNKDWQRSEGRLKRRQAAHAAPDKHHHTSAIVLLGSLSPLRLMAGETLHWSIA